MIIEKIHKVYFLGIGGIGMSALARYFHIIGKDVSGYDKTASDITKDLEELGIEINYSDKVSSIPERFVGDEARDNSLIIYTPAIPQKSLQLNYFKEKNYELVKRSKALGIISEKIKTIAISGSHGKTTISAMVAEIFRSGDSGGAAFLGGVSKTLGSNLLLEENAEIAVMEADEFDMSFHALHPDFALVSSMDPDHLDIYGDKDHLRQSFEDFLKRLPLSGTVVIKEGLHNIIPENHDLNVLFYGLERGRDYHALNIKPEGVFYAFDLNTPKGIIQGFKTSLPGLINVENAVGAASICLEAGCKPEDVKDGISKFLGIKRRFDIRINSDDIVYIDDYAHHPVEIKSFLNSVRILFPQRKLIGVFQPHLYSRTRDFAAEFAEELDLLDEVFLLDIYPAREEAMKGVSSKLILDEMKSQKKKIVSRLQILRELGNVKQGVVLTMGAGDIDRLVKPIEELLKVNAS